MCEVKAVAGKEGRVKNAHLKLEWTHTPPPHTLSLEVKQRGGISSVTYVPFNLFTQSLSLTTKRDFPAAHAGVGKAVAVLEEEDDEAEYCGE